MSDDKKDALIARIDAYDGTEEQFASIMTDALALVAERHQLSGFMKEMARRLGGIPPSTIGSYARGAACPGPHVRPAVLGEVRDIIGRP